jgi:allophanate hydrolase
MDIATLSAAYRAGTLTPSQVITQIIADSTVFKDRNVWITPPESGWIQPWLDRLAGIAPSALPLYGIPFAIKDNIDLKGLPTTAACPEFAYLPARSATVVERLLAAGAIPVGKTNLDQFATGLNGTRSPYGACANAFDPRFISGGSSSGSAVSVALGLASFALGTDTAGSGRVPAGFNNLVGLKPSLGLLPTTGVVPACRTLDVVSIFARNSQDAASVLAVAAGPDDEDPYSRAAPTSGIAQRWPHRFRFGVPRPDQLDFQGDVRNEALFAGALARLSALGGEAVQLDFAPFLETAQLLYGGPWVAERYQSIRNFIDASPQAVFPVTRQITLGGKSVTAADTFAAFYRLQSLRKVTARVWQDIDVMITPTAPTIYTIEEMLAEPVQRNSHLGYYTNFVNLLDLSAIAVPAGFARDGLPNGITLIGPAFHEAALLDLAARWQLACPLPVGATQHVTAPPGQPGWVRVAVCGAHMLGLPLNPQLQSRGARLVAVTETAPCYRLYALPDGKRPGLLRSPGGGAIALEVWELPVETFGSFVDGIPSPLVIGRVELASGDTVAGFLCEPHALGASTEITSHGGWRSWLRSAEQRGH